MRLPSGLPLPPLQFGLHHSSDSAIVKVISHLCIPEFIGQFSTLLLLDISAFHKVDTHLLDTSSFIFQDAHTPSFISISLIFLLSFLSQFFLSPQLNLVLDLLSMFTPLVIGSSLLALNTISVILQLKCPTQTSFPNSRLVFSVAYLTFQLRQLQPRNSSSCRQLHLSCQQFFCNCSNQKLLNQSDFSFYFVYQKILLVLYLNQIQSLTTNSCHFHCYHSGPGHHISCLECCNSLLTGSPVSDMPPIVNLEARAIFLNVRHSSAENAPLLSE